MWCRRTRCGLKMAERRRENMKKRKWKEGQGSCKNLNEAKAKERKQSEKKVDDSDKSKVVQ